MLSVFLILTIFMIFLLEDAEGARKKARPRFVSSLMKRGRAVYVASFSRQFVFFTGRHYSTRSSNDCSQSAREIFKTFGYTSCMCVCSTDHNIETDVPL